MKGGALSLEYLDPAGLAWAQRTVTEHHYRHAPVDARACPEAWAVRLDGIGRVGCLICCRPEATRNYPWYGSRADVASGRAEMSYWCVLNLARVWLSPDVQRGGKFFGPEILPGFLDRRGTWHPALASAAIALLARCVGAQYLTARPPVFLDQPYEVRHLLSYCDTAHHRGLIYRAAHFALYRTNTEGLQTWRLPLPPLTAEQDAAIREVSRWNRRARRLRAAGTARQPTLFEVA